MIVACGLSVALIAVTVQGSTVFFSQIKADFDRDVSEKGSNRFMVEFDNAMKTGTDFLICENPDTWISQYNTTSGDAVLIIPKSGGTALAFALYRDPTGVGADELRIYYDFTYPIYSVPTSYYVAAVAPENRGRSRTLTKGQPLVTRVGSMAVLSWSIDLPQERLSFTTMGAPFYMK
jgi:hypothetical protein